MKKKKPFSIIVPVHNESDNILPLLYEFDSTFGRHDTFEVIYVDDASTDSTARVLRAALAKFTWLRVIEHDQQCGQSAALCSGIAVALTSVIATLDGDGQNDPSDIPRLLDLYQASSQETMLAGHRVNRQDDFLKRVSSRVANVARSSYLSDGIPDTGCGLKVFSRELFLHFEPFDHMHRFLPALAISQGALVKSVPVNHRERIKGETKYGLHNRLWVGIEDMLGVRWVQQSRSIERKCLGKKRLSHLQNWRDRRGQAWLNRRQCDAQSQEIIQ